MGISVIIPNYNGQNLLEKNLPKVIDVLSYYKSGKIEIIVIDDASTDASVTVISDIQAKLTTSKQYKHITFVLIQNSHNLGFSPTVNKGAQKATGEILVLLNTDVVPEKDFLNPLLEHFSNKNVFAVGCMDKSHEGEKTILRGRGVGSWKRGFLVHSRGEVDKNSTLWISGGSAAVRRSMFEKLSGFDELYTPFYWEDIDLSFRAQKYGYSIFFEKKSVVNHFHSEGAIKSEYSDSHIKTIAYRNQFIFVWKNITDSKFLLSHFFWLPYHTTSALLRGNTSFLKGLLLATFKLPAIIDKRFMQKKYFIETDQEILNQFNTHNLKPE